MKKAYKYRLYPAKREEAIMQIVLNTCRILYNTSLSERKEAYEQNKESVSYYDQVNTLKEAKIDNKWLKDTHSQILQDVLKRLEKAFQNFFRRVKKGEKSGYPRYKGYDRYDSFTYPQSGYKIEGSKVILSKIGAVNIKLHREISEEAIIKSCTIKREANQWYAIFTVELPDEEVQKAAIANAVGMDLGITELITLSNGEKINNPKWLRTSEKKLAKEQRRLSHKKKGSANRKKQKLVVQRAHRKIKSQRTDFLHKVSTKLVAEYDFIAMEKLNIKGMVKNKYLAKSISDAGWNKLVSFISYKAVGAGKIVELVNPKGTTQECSCCGEAVPKTLAVRMHKCPYCGLVMDRDKNAAINILKRGILKVGQGLPEFTPVEIFSRMSMKQDATQLIGW